MTMVKIPKIPPHLTGYYVQIPTADIVLVYLTIEIAWKLITACINPVVVGWTLRAISESGTNSVKEGQ